MSRSEAKAYKQAIARRRHYLANRQYYLDMEKKRREDKIAADPTRDCQWCGHPYPRVQYGPRQFCSKQCRRLSQRNTMLLKQYGITLDQYLLMLEEQGNRCALCGRFSKFTLAVEHSHITGTVRGLCCMTCNRDIIGAIDGNIERFDRAIKFLTKAREDLKAHLEKETRVETPPSTLVP